MKKNALTTAVLAGLTGLAGMVSVASAVNVNPDGLGQVLIYPYYTARGGNDTLISVVNTTSDAKAVKVRFLEALNSREVLDFNLYLSEFDVWTASISDLTPLGINGPGLVVPDSSCTVPDIFGLANANFVDGEGNEFQRGAVPFTNLLFRGSRTDGGPTDISRTESGYVEIIEMGVVTNDTKDSADAATHVVFEDEINPVRRPADCDQLNNAWIESGRGQTIYEADIDNYWTGIRNPDGGVSGFGPDVDLDAPSGGIFGRASIISVGEGTMFGYNATPIDGFAAADIADGDLHAIPGSTQPNLNSGGEFVSNVFDNGQFVTDDWENTSPGGGPAASVLAVSAVLTFDTLMNEYDVNPGLNAASEWVVTLPTKRFYVDEGFFDNFVGVADGDAVKPFNETFSATTRAPGSDAGACEVVKFTVIDREEAIPGTTGPEPKPPVFSPSLPEEDPPIETFDLCYEANVIRFDNSLVDEDAPAAPGASEILKETRFTTLPAFNEGWARLDFNGTDLLDPAGNVVVHQSLRTAADRVYRGLPAIGIWVNTAQNGVLETGVKSNYGASFNHHGTRNILNWPIATGN